MIKLMGATHCARALETPLAMILSQTPLTPDRHPLDSQQSYSHSSPASGA
jgi:hypothetical protein